jgi:hypothetical protein
VRPRYGNAIYGLIDPECRPEHSKYVLTHIGFEDSVVNHVLLMRDMREYDYDDMDLDRRMNHNQLA